MIDNSGEYILCAAIWFDDGVFHYHQPKNVETGLVFCGHRHGCIFAQIGGTVGERQKLGIFEKEQGFLTNTNRFVNRLEALEIAKKTNQLKPDEYVHDRIGLFSENLY